MPFSVSIKILKASQDLSEIMGDHLIRLSELLIQNNKIPNRDVLLNALSEANKSITNYIDTVKLPEAREGALVLKNLYDYQEQLLQEIRTIRRVMANVQQASKVSLKERTRVSFNVAGIQTERPCSKFQFDSTMFRHSLRLTIAIVFAYL
jgi:uncharacterized membrane protein YccC